MWFPRLICVYYKGEFIVAQYTHWGASPDQYGVAILQFLRHPSNIERLKQRAEFVEEITDESEKERFMDMTLGRESLDIVSNADATYRRRVVKELEVVNTGACCEWAHVVDLDKSTFEVFKSYAKKKYPGSTRFADVGGPEDTVPRFAQPFDFSNLPTPKEFVESFGIRYTEQEEVDDMR
jgi:hypothetical protein